MSRKSATLPRIRVTPETKAKIERLALEDQRTLSDYVRLVLMRHLKSVECLRELASEPKGKEVWLDDNGEIT